MPEIHSIAHFTLEDMALLMRALRHCGADSQDMETAAKRIVRHFRERFRNPDNGSCELPLVRFYKVHEYGKLPEDLRLYARSMFPAIDLVPSTRCLVLLATAGEHPDWNARRQSRGHQVLPLLSIETVKQMPMVYTAISQLGIEVADVISPHEEFVVSRDTRSYNVFYVPEALGSPYIPVQDDFVKAYGIRSVLGFGGILPSASLFVVILFSNQLIPVETAQVFKSLAMSVKVAVVPFDEVAVFEI